MTPGRPTRPILPAVAVLAAVCAAGCNAHPARPPEPSAISASEVKRMSPKRLQEYTAENGILAGARAGNDIATAQAIPPAPPADQMVGIPPVPVPPAPAVPPVPSVPAVRVEHTRQGVSVVSVTAPARPTAVPARVPVISLTGIKSDKPHADHDRALEDALQVAQVEIMKALQQLNPPVVAKPSLSTIRSEYLRRDSVKEVSPSEAVKAEWKEKKLDAKMWVTVDVELSEEQVQKLRAGERVGTAFQYGAVLFAALLAVYGFLRLDTWSKGYLTSWLAIGAVVLVALALLAVVS